MCHRLRTSNITAAELALECGFKTAAHLSHLFKLETGYNFKQYLTRMRIGEAQKLLDESDIRISEIAGKVGYEDPAYFSKSFFRETGMTPREYRTYIRV